MPSLTESISSFISSIVGVFTSIISSILALFQNIFGMFFDLIRTFFASIGALISGLAHTFEGLLKFLLSNIVVLGGILVALFLYGVYMQRNGQVAPAGNNKKIN